MFLLDDNLANQIVNYLAGRPWNEVDSLITGMKAMQPIPQAPVVDEPVVDEPIIAQASGEDNPLEV